MHANRQLWHCSWMFKYGSKHDVHIMDFASEPVPKVIYNQAGIWSLFGSSVIKLKFMGMLAKNNLFLLSGLTTDKFCQCFMFQILWFQPLLLLLCSVTIRLTLRNPERAFQNRLPKVNILLSCAKELSQIMAGWCVRVDSLCLDKINTKSFWLQAASRLLSLFSS